MKKKEMKSCIMKYSYSYLNHQPGHFSSKITAIVYYFASIKHIQIYKYKLQCTSKVADQDHAM